MTRGLSLKAEVLLLAIDPGDGGLLTTGRKLGKAVALAAAAEGGGGSARAATRAAREELVDAGLIERHRPLRPLRLKDRLEPARRFNAVQRSVTTGEFADARNEEVFVLLAGCGALAQRMGRDQRRLARRRLRSLIPEPNASGTAASPGVGALALFGAAGFGVFDAAGTSDFDATGGGGDGDGGSAGGDGGSQ